MKRIHPTVLLMASAHFMVDGYGNIHGIDHALVGLAIVPLFAAAVSMWLPRRPPA